MKYAILLLLTMSLVGKVAFAQWDVNENFNDGIPDNWTVTEGEWYWEESGTFQTPYIWTATDSFDTAELIAGPYDISDVDHLVFQFHYFVNSPGDSEVYCAFSPDGPWYILAYLSIPGRMYGVFNHVFTAEQLQGDEIYFRWQALFNPDGTVYEYAIDKVRLSAQFPGWLDVNFDWPLFHNVSPGGLIEFDMTVTNTFNIPVDNLQYRMLLQRVGTVYGPFDQQQFLVPANGTLQVENMTFEVPGELQSGTYMVTPLVGVPGRASLKFSDWWYFFLQNPGGDVANGRDPLAPWIIDWPYNDPDETSGSPAQLAGREHTTTAFTTPEKFSVSPVYPNPFNPATTIRVALPEASDLTVTVYNTLGQQVAQLAHGSFAVGTHSFTFDGSHLASGIYFVHATVPGQLNAMQKIVLMK